MKKLLYYPTIVLCLVIVSCSETNDSEIQATNASIKVEQFEMLSGNWELVDITTGEGTIVLPPTQVNVIFSESENESNNVFLLDGQSTCNQYGGELTALDDKTIEFEQLYSTEMLCEDAILNDFEIQYYSWLFDAKEYHLEGNTLYLEGGVTLKFTKLSN